MNVFAASALTESVRIRLKPKEHLGRSCDGCLHLRGRGKSGLLIAHELRQMHNVQIAIPDRTYAQGLRDLLMADGQHQVYIVDYPSPAIDGVAVVDDAMTNRMKLSGGFDFDRCVVFTRTVPIEVNRLWEAGVRHVIQADYPPHVGRLVVLAAEKRLGGSAVFDPELSMSGETDKLFLHSMGISDS
jgi:hypothetical protein